jgi:hypothetical protein
MNHDRQQYEWRLLAQFILDEPLWIVCSTAVAWAQKPAHSLRATDFQDFRNALIFFAIKEISQETQRHGHSCDRVTLVGIEDLLRERELLEFVGGSFLLDFSGAVVSMGLDVKLGGWHTAAILAGGFHVERRN